MRLLLDQGLPGIEPALAAKPGEEIQPEDLPVEVERHVVEGQPE